MAPFWILVAIDAAAAAVIFWFLLAGLGDGTVSANNALIWLLLIAWPIAALGGGFALRAQRRLGLAKLVLCILAVPAMLGLAFMLLLLVLQPDFR